MFGACPPGYQQECARLKVPLDHEQPDGEAIDFHVARRRGAQGSKRQLWLLAGGPGQGGQVWSGVVERLSQELPDTDVYVVDHRGTGHSYRLTCPQQDKPGTYGGYSLPTYSAKSCLSALKKKGDKDKLRYFTTTQAARDLAAAIEATREPGQQVHVWGASYGTHLAHRLAQVSPGRIDGILFDGFMTPRHFAFSRYDQGVEEVGKIFAQGCAQDAACAARFGPDPWKRAREIADAQAAGACGGIFSRQVIQAWGSAFLDGVDARAFVFPFLHRIERCSPQDVQALQFLLDRYTEALTGATEDEPFLNSGVLQYNIALSELWSLPEDGLITKEYLEEKAKAQLFLAGASSYPASLVPLRDFWPIAPDDYSDKPVPAPSPPRMLWLSGGLDTRTPPQQAARVQDLYKGPPSWFTVIPGAGHTPMFASPQQDPSKLPCGLEISLDFVRKEGAPGLGCLEKLEPVRYAAPDATFAMQWWGTEDDWGDGQVSPATPAPAKLMTFRPEPTLAAQLAAHRWRTEWRPR